MRHLLVVLALLLPTLAVAHPDGTLGLHQHIDTIVSNPLAVHMRDACIHIAGGLPAVDAPWIDPLTGAQEVQCVTWIVKKGIGVVDRQIAEDEANIAFAAALAASEAAVDAAMPDSEIIPAAVCGDGIVTPVAGEECDDGGSNSDSTPDACRTNCANAFCGDGVIDTGEVCDPGSDDTCMGDCSGTIP